jgi:Putative amidoligase enzyme
LATPVKKKPVEKKLIRDTVIGKLHGFASGITDYDSYLVPQTPVYSTEFPDLPRIYDSECRIGIEIEVENIPGYSENHMYCWQVHRDDSLRNNGLEFVTFPICGQQIPLALNILFSKILPKGYEFTKRTSDHVHMNVRDMTPTQIASMVCLFIVFEKLLYKWVGKDRDKNIFCVPLQETLIANSLLTAIDSGFRDVRWYKYSGLNLLPIMTQGSIEFRQLYGTDDTTVIVTWINMIQRMRAYAMSYPMEDIIKEISDLNTNSNYDMFLTRVFANDARLLSSYDGVMADMENGVMCVKQCTLNNVFHQQMLKAVLRKSPLVKTFDLPAKPAKEEPMFTIEGSLNNLVRGLTIDTTQYDPGNWDSPLVVPTPQDFPRGMSAGPILEIQLQQAVNRRGR